MFPINDLQIEPPKNLEKNEQWLKTCVPTLCVFTPTNLDVKSSSANSTRVGSEIEAWFQENMPCARFAMATRCGVSKSKPLELEACRKHLKWSLEEADARLILCYGPEAWEAVVGTKARRLRSYAWSPNGYLAVLLPPISRAIDNIAVRSQLLTYTKGIIGGCVEAAGVAFPPPPTDTDVLVAETRSDVRRIVSEIRAYGSCAFDVETYGRKFHDSDYHLLSIAFACTEDAVYVIPKDLIKENADALGRIFSDKHLLKFGQNVKFDVGAIKKALDIDTVGIGGDSRLFSKLLANTESASLADMSHLVGMGTHKDEAHNYVKTEISRLKSEGKPQPGAYAYAAIPEDILWRYNALDAVATFRLCRMFKGALRRTPDLKRACLNIVLPASGAITHVEFWGMPVDRAQIEALSTFIESKQTELEKVFSAESLNPDSPVSVGHYLFDVKGYPVKDKTPGGKPSVSAAVLKSMTNLDPMVGNILEWRKLSKVKSTYADGLLPHITDEGRVHSDLLLDGTASGRLSCREPNLQNIPRADTDLGRAIRLAFRPKKGLMFLQADYSQLELRVAAMLSGDPEMAEIFTSGVDYHQRTAELVSKSMWGIEPSEVKKLHRQAAKTFNFGLLYGMSNTGIAKQIGCSVDEAAHLRISILGKFHVLADWISEQVETAKSFGYASTWWAGEKARRRWLPDLFSSDKKAQSSARRATWNTPVQGTASDICLKSLVEIVNWIRADHFPAKVVSTVHDSIMLELGEDCLDEGAWHMKKIMTRWESRGIPFVVDMEVGPSWAELETYEPPEDR